MFHAINYLYGEFEAGRLSEIELGLTLEAYRVERINNAPPLKAAQSGLQLVNLRRRVRKDRPRN